MFWLRTGSPAIGKGTPQHAPLMDFWGRPRPDARPLDAALDSSTIRLRILVRSASGRTSLQRGVRGISMDLHCSIRPDIVRTVQFLDNLRLEVYIPPLLEMRLLRDVMWRDESVLPVEVRLRKEMEEVEDLVFRLMDAQEKVVVQWSRPPQTAIVGLSLSETLLPQGCYLLCSELRDDKGNVLTSAEATLEVAVSPWGDAPKSHPKTTKTRRADEAPEVFQVMGDVAPTFAMDVLPEQPEMLSPDVDLSQCRKRGYAVFSRHYLDEVSRLGRPRPGEFGDVRLFETEE